MPTPYQIKKGDSLSAIAAQNKTDVPSLLKLNPTIKDPNLIREGATLNLPDSPTSIPSPIADQFKSSSGVVTSDPLRNAEIQKKTEQLKQDQEEEQELLRLQRRSAIQTLKDTTAPERPDLVGTFTKLRSEQGIADLETSLADTRRRKLELRNQLTQFKNRTSGQGRTQTEVNTAVNVEAQKLQEEFDRLNIEESSLADQIKTKNSVIETIMNLTEKDYDNAKDDYDRQFTQAIQTINTIKGLTEDEKTAEEKKQDNARANLQILANQLSSGDLVFSQLDPAQQAEINRLELQAGLPTGTIARIKDNNPKADIVSSTTRTDAAGNKYLDIVTRDKVTGALKVETTTLGKERVPSPGGGGTSTGGGSSDGFKFTQAQLQTASGKANIPLHDLKQLPGEVINVFTSGQYDQLKKQVDKDLEDYVSPSEIEREVSNDSTLPDPVKDALVRHLKSQAKRYQ